MLPFIIFRAIAELLTVCSEREETKKYSLKVRTYFMSGDYKMQYKVLRYRTIIVVTSLLSFKKKN